jgi:hypothetical protein
MNQVGVEQKRVVISQNAGTAEIPERLDDSPRTRTQGRDVTEADNLVNTQLLDVIEHGLQGYFIRMDVGDQRDPHD